MYGFLETVYSRKRFNEQRFAQHHLYCGIYEIRGAFNWEQIFFGTLIYLFHLKEEFLSFDAGKHDSQHFWKL